jgi:murein DD-endopeptidase MepM/ murein hydrolase activator NlpD
MQVEARHRGGGLDPRRDRARANFVRILHDDGSMALYAHLAPGGVRVQVSQAVAAGEPIAWSGNTGYSTGPHLHFAVQVNRGLRLVSIPFRMPGVTAPAAPRAP